MTKSQLIKKITDEEKFIRDRKQGIAEEQMMLRGQLENLEALKSELNQIETREALSTRIINVQEVFFINVHKLNVHEYIEKRDNGHDFSELLNGRHIKWLS